MNEKSLKLVASPMIAMVQNMIPKEAPSNRVSEFAGELINAFMPDGDDMMSKVKEIITDVAIVHINRAPEDFELRLHELKDKLDMFLKED